MIRSACGLTLSYWTTLFGLNRTKQRKLVRMTKTARNMIKLFIETAAWWQSGPWTAIESDVGSDKSCYNSTPCWSVLFGGFTRDHSWCNKWSKWPAGIVEKMEWATLLSLSICLSVLQTEIFRHTSGCMDFTWWRIQLHLVSWTSLRVKHTVLAHSGWHQ